MKQASRWINKLKISILDKDFKTIESLATNLPEFKTLEQMQEAQALVAQSIEVITKAKQELKLKMDNLKKSKKFFDNERVNSFEKSY